MEKGRLLVVLGFIGLVAIVCAMYIQKTSPQSPQPAELNCDGSHIMIHQVSDSFMLGYVDKVSAAVRDFMVDHNGRLPAPDQVGEVWFYIKYGPLTNPYLPGNRPITQQWLFSEETFLEPLPGEIRVWVTKKHARIVGYNAHGRQLSEVWIYQSG